MIGVNHRMISSTKRIDQNVFLNIASNVNHILSYPETPKEGDLMFAFMAHSSSYTVSEIPDDWTQITAANSDTRLFYKVAGPAETNSYNFVTSAATALRICAVTFSGRNPDEAEYGDVSTATSAAMNVGSLATTPIDVNEGATVFAFVNYAGTATAPPTANNSFTFLNGDTTLGTAALYHRQYDIAESSQNVTFTSSGSNGRMRAIMLEVYPT